MQKDGTTTTRDGAQLQYTLHESDKPGVPRLTLIHSLALDRSIWDGVVKELGADADILALDARGHGGSSKPAGPYTTKMFGDDVRDVLQSIGWEHTIVAGASMGGSVAIQFAVSYPEMLDGLALIDTTAWYGADAPKSWHDRGQKVITDGLASMIAFQQTRWFSDGFRTANPKIVDHFAEVFLKSDLKAYAATCDMLGAFDLRSEIGAIAVPTEILVGEEDYATPPEMARELHAAIPGSNLTIVEGARHLTPIQIPDRVAAIIRAVIAKAQKGDGVANRG